MADAVEIFLVLRNARKFIEDATKSSHAVEQIGTDAEKSGKKAGIGWKGMAKWAGGAAAIYGASRYIKDAVSSTESLAKSTMAVQRTTGMDTVTASAWVGVLKERNVSTQTFGRTLATLSKQMETARTGTVTQRKTMAQPNIEHTAKELGGGKSASAALARLRKQREMASKKGASARATMKLLGASTADIAKGNIQGVILSIADSFKAMKNPAERTALAQKLFGRSAQALLPILVKGREGVQAALDTQIKYGNVLHGKGVKDTYEFIRKQRDLHAATEGLKVTLGTALMPAILSIATAIMKVVDVIQPLLRQGWLVKTLIGVLIVAFLAWKVAIMAATVASWELSAATWASIGIWVLVIAAIIAVAVGVYVLYKKWKWFHDFINASWDWIKKHWPLLLGILTGPFGLAAAYIITHWTQVRDFVLGVVDAIVKAFHKVLDIGKNVVKGATGIVKKIPGGHAALSVAKHLVPHFATGGVLTYSGAALVGEHGPELLALPGGATITPLAHDAQLTASGGTVEIVVPLYLNGRVLAQAIAQYSADKLARR
jgi:hypothetical protein